MDARIWNNRLQELKGIILLPENTEKSKQLIIELHRQVHAPEVYQNTNQSFDDLIWNGFNENLFRTATNEKGRTVLYGVWHSARIEDITLNLLVADKQQVFEEGNWQQKINSAIKHTGNSLNEKEIIEFSSQINIRALKEYRIAVGKSTGEIIKNLYEGQLNNKVYKENLPLIIKQKAVDNVESANWLIDFWGKKTIAGIILMPALRHNLTHINESLKTIKKNKRKYL